MNTASAESAFSTIPATTGSFSWSGNKLIYTPDSLNYSTAYNVTIGTGAVDLAGNNLSSVFEWQFTTAAKSSMIKNPGFESGTSPWTKSTNGVMTFSAAAPGYEGSYAGKLAISSIGTNIQIYQGITLEPNTHYRLSFAAYSTTGHDMIARLILGVSPYSTIGTAYTANLNNTWQTFTTEFDNAGTVTTARLQFFLGSTTPGLAAAGDIYYIDNVVLEKII
ncbi:Carbohydrate binding domain protein [uncultured archaeon]|nr:Carbohydrate binding domain protein [uncultured archaeon]